MELVDTFEINYMVQVVRESDRYALFLISGFMLRHDTGHIPPPPPPPPTTLGQTTPFTQTLDTLMFQNLRSVGVGLN